MPTERTWQQSLERLYNPRRDKCRSPERPHKPVLLLAILGLFERGRVKANQVALGPRASALALVYLLATASCAHVEAAAPATKPPAARFPELASLLRPGTHLLRLSEGDYELGPQTLDLPADFQLVGAGAATVIHARPGTTVALRLGSGARLSHLRFDAHDAEHGGVNDFFIFIPRESANVTLDHLQVLDCPRTAIGLDHATDVIIRDCRFERIALGLNILFSRNVRVQDNTVLDATIHGLQFWGNWRWQQQDADNLLFCGNTVRNGGNCGIWGSGARHVVLANNFVDGCADVGLDLEWCSDSVISANIARRCKNAGIALFFACTNVAITGNSIANDAPISPAEAKAEWWARSGIWLTYPNRRDFKSDHGHQNVTIVGNSITCAPGERRAVWVGAEARNVVVANNALLGGHVWSGGRDGERPMRLTLEPDNIRLGADAPAAADRRRPTTPANPNP